MSNYDREFQEYNNFLAMLRGMTNRSTPIQLATGVPINRDGLMHRGMYLLYKYNIENPNHLMESVEAGKGRPHEGTKNLITLSIMARKDPESEQVTSLTLNAQGTDAAKIEALGLRNARPAINDRRKIWLQAPLITYEAADPEIGYNLKRSLMFFRGILEGRLIV